MTTCGKVQKKSLYARYDFGVSSGENTLIQAYLKVCGAENMAKGTIKIKRHHLIHLAKRVSLEQATEDDLVAHLSNPDWGPETRKSARSTFRTFYAWAFRRGITSHDPSAYLKAIRVPTAKPRPVPEADVMDAVAFGDDDETTLMVLLAAYAGLRASEIAGLRTDAMTPYGIRIMGKGGKERIVPVHPTILAPLTKRIRRIEGEWVFPSPVRNSHVGYDYIHKRVSAALGGKYTPHQLRHRFATQAYKGTQDLRAVQELLGHSSHTTTVRYTLIENEAMDAAVRAVA
jgi:site-specific recombinase XerD